MSLKIFSATSLKESAAFRRYKIQRSANGDDYQELVWAKGYDGLLSYVIYQMQTLMYSGHYLKRTATTLGGH